MSWRSNARAHSHKTTQKTSNNETMFLSLPLPPLLTSRTVVLADTTTGMDSFPRSTKKEQRSDLSVREREMKERKEGMDEALDLEEGRRSLKEREK